MSDTQAAMREFRFLDEKRKTSGLLPDEEQRWQELAAQLGIDLSQAMGGYWGMDGQWYAYPVDGQYDASAYPGYTQQGYDPNAQGYDPNAQGYDPNAQGYDPNAQGYDPNAQAYDPNAQGYDPSAQGYDPNAQGYDPNAQAYDPNYGYYDPNAYPAAHAGPTGNAPQWSQPQWQPQAYPAAAPGVPATSPQSAPESADDGPTEVSDDEVMEVSDEDVTLLDSTPSPEVAARRAAPAPVAKRAPIMGKPFRAPIFAAERPLTEKRLVPPPPSAPLPERRTGLPPTPSRPDPVAAPRSRFEEPVKSGLVQMPPQPASAKPPGLAPPPPLSLPKAPPSAPGKSGAISTWAKPSPPRPRPSPPAPPKSPPRPTAIPPQVEPALSAPPQPAAAAESVVVAEPVIAVEPVVAAEPVIAAEPAVAAEPVIAVEPVIAAEPAVAAEPVIAAEPAVAAEPVIAAEPAVAAEPVIAAESGAEPTVVAESELAHVEVLSASSESAPRATVPPIAHTPEPVAAPVPAEAMEARATVPVLEDVPVDLDEEPDTAPVDVASLVAPLATPGGERTDTASVGPVEEPISDVTVDVVEPPPPPRPSMPDLIIDEQPPLTPPPPLPVRQTPQPVAVAPIEVPEPVIDAEPAPLVDAVAEPEPSIVVSPELGTPVVHVPARHLDQPPPPPSVAFETLQPPPPAPVDFDAVIDDRPLPIEPVVDLSGAASDRVELASTADFISPPAQDVPPVDVDMGVEQPIIEAASLAQLANPAAEAGVEEATSPEEAPLILASNADFLERPDLQSTGQAWQRTGPQALELSEDEEGEPQTDLNIRAHGVALGDEPEDDTDVITGVVIEDEEEPTASAVPTADLFDAPRTQPSLAVAPPPAPRPSQPNVAQPRTVANPAPPEGPHRPPTVPGPPVPVTPSQLFDKSGQSLHDEPQHRIVVRGEHRVILHTLEGQVKRGTITDADLGSDHVNLDTGSGGVPERIPRPRVKAIFFMLPAGAKTPAPDGKKVRVTFKDGRQVAGFSRDHQAPGPGFFVVPADNRTNTSRIFIFRHSVQAIAVD